MPSNPNGRVVPLKEKISSHQKAWELDIADGRRIIEALRSGFPLTDRQFDKLFSPNARRCSKRHWTPVETAKRAASLLTEGLECKILDVGSGVGKFCIVGALSTPATYFGVEQRKWLVSESNYITQSLPIPRVHFLSTQMNEIDWGEFDHFYFYNPFYEQIVESARIDENVEFATEHYDAYVTWVKMQLAKARTGTKVVTFHGMGGEMPPSYELICRETNADGYLELWEKKEKSVVKGFDFPVIRTGRETDFDLPCTD